MKKNIFIIISTIAIFLCNHSVVGAKNSYFIDGKKLFDKKKYKDSKLYFEKDIVFRVRKCLEAGCDMVLVCNQADDVDNVLNKLSWIQDSVSIKRLLNMHRVNHKNTERDSSQLNFSYEDAKKGIKELQKLGKKFK